MIAVELQGHGRTRDIERQFSFQQDAEDVVGLLKHLQIGQADFFGESFGGIIAMQIAIRHPKLVRRVVTYGSPFGTLQESSRHESLAQLVTLTADHPSVQYQRESYQRVTADPAQWSTVFAKSVARQVNGFSQEDLKSIKARL